MTAPDATPGAADQDVLEQRLCHTAVGVQDSERGVISPVLSDSHGGEAEGLFGHFGI